MVPEEGKYWESMIAWVKLYPAVVGFLLHASGCDIVASGVESSI